MRPSEDTDSIKKGLYMEKQQPISIWLGMSHIVVYSIANRMYMAEYTSLEHAEQKIEEIKKPPNVMSISCTKPNW